MAPKRRGRSGGEDDAAGGLADAAACAAASRPTSPPAKKKQAADDDVLAYRPPSHQLAALTDWLPGAGVVLNADAIALTSSAGGGVAVHAVAPLPPGTLLATIPKTAVLSCTNSAVAPVLRSAHLAGGLGLAVAVAAEAAAGGASPWGGYLASLPRPAENLPALWGGAALAAAAGSDLPSRATADAAAVREDFVEHVAPLAPALAACLARAYGASPSLPPRATLQDRLAALPLFWAATSWVASRSFGVDAVHGRAMVPLADAFNHKAALVDLGGGGRWAVERVCFADSEDDEDEDDGGGGGSGSSSGEEGDGSGGGGESSPPSSPPANDDASASADDDWATLAVPPRHDGLHLELAICGGEDPASGAPRLECRAASSIAGGAQVHNTYGEHGCGDLAARYGFALASPVPGPFDAVALRVGALLASAAALPGGSARGVRARARLLGEADLLDGRGEPLEVSAGGVVGAGLRVVLRLLGASESEFATWTRLEDATRPATGGEAVPLGAVALADAARADPPLTPRAAAVLRGALEARLGEYPPPGGGGDDTVEAASAAVAAAASALDRSPSAEAGAALRAAQAILTARVVVRAERAVLAQAVQGVEEVLAGQTEIF